MTKEEFISRIAKETGISKALAEKVVNSFTSNVTRVLKRGERLSLTGFGTFSVVRRRARKGRHPQTGKEIKIPSTRVARFKPGKLLKAEIK